MVGSDLWNCQQHNAALARWFLLVPDIAGSLKNSLRLASVSGDSSVRVVTQPIRMAQ